MSMMNVTLLCVAMVCFVSSVMGQACTARTNVANFNLTQASGEWFVYQLANKNASTQTQPLCAHYTVTYVNPTNIVLNYTRFVFNSNRFFSNAGVYKYNASVSGLVVEDAPPTPTGQPTRGGINFNWLLTDYTSYAFINVCQNVGTGHEEYVMLLVRSLTNSEMSIFPVIGTVFSTFFALTGYNGGDMQYVNRDPVLCMGL